MLWGEILDSPTKGGMKNRSNPAIPAKRPKMDIEGYCLRLDCCGCLETLGRGPGEYMEADKAAELQPAIQYEEAFVVVDYCRTYYEAVRPAEEVSILSLCPDCGTCDTSFGRFVLNSFINSWNSPCSSASKRLVLTRLSLSSVGHTGCLPVYMRFFVPVFVVAASPWRHCASRRGVAHASAGAERQPEALSELAEPEASPPL